jgi:LuxR family maltose regulon positive regulatory protein
MEAASLERNPCVACLSPEVERLRLVELLQRGALGPFTLVSAPAGMGKSVLLHQWMAANRSSLPVAWLPLRREHRDRRRFWTEVVAALGAADAELAGLAPPPREALEPFLGSLLDALGALARPLALVLDDLHLVSGPEILADLDWMLEAEPRGLRLVAATRSDPPLRLQRLRAAGKLGEVRAADLAFSLAETRELLAPLRLEDGDLASLWRRSEGWVTGLRLAQLSLERRSDHHEFIESFAGSDAAVSDYLTAEVLAAERPRTLSFLLRTSVADSLCGALAEALTQDSGADRWLRELAGGNAFVSTLDTPAGWYRYHRLFADVLRGELHRRMPDLEPLLHRRAGRWHADHGNPVDAVRHFIVAADWGPAGQVLGEEWLVQVLRGNGAVLLELAAALPREVVHSDAELALALAGLLLEQGELDAADELLERAYELALDLPEERRRRFAVTSTATALYRARLHGDLPEAVDAAREVLDGSWDREVATDVRALTLANLGIAEFWAGGISDAGAHLQQAAGLALECGNDFVLFLAEAYAAAVDARQGRLEAAAARARTAIQLAERRGWTRQAHAAIAYTTLGSVELWRKAPAEAERCAGRATKALERAGEPLLGAAVAQFRARALLAQGQSLAALELVQGAAAGPPLPEFLRASGALLEAELWLLLGEPTRARSVLMELTEAACPDALLGLARIELASGDPAAALRAVIRFVSVAREPILPWSRVDAWVLAAIARDALHDQDGALRALERALGLAEPRGFGDVIERYGPPVRSLLRRRISRGTAHRALAGSMLSSLDAVSAPSGPSAPAALLEPLSERELTVLRFLPTMMSNAQIAGEMFVSVNTVKTHLKHVYRKLDVTDRRDCVARARQLRLLSPGLGER